MKRIQSKAGLLKKRVRSVQAKAKVVGIAYLLGAIALAVVSALFSLTRGTILSTEDSFTVIKFYEEFMTLIGTEGGFMAVLTDPALLMKLLILVLYVVLLLVVVINVFRALSKLNWLFKRRASYVNGFNRNMYAMDDISKRYASSFAAVIIINLLFILLSMGGENSAAGVTMATYIVLGAGLVVHIIFGLLEGSVMLFTTGDKIEEEEREHGLFIYFIRNVVQIAAIAGMLFFLLDQSKLGSGLNSLLTELIVNKNFMYAIDLACIPTYVELALWIFMMVMIKHATAGTEYNRDCNQTSGMKNFLVFSLLSFLMIAALVVLPYLGIGVAEGEEVALNMSLVWAGVIAFVAFLFDCICRAKDKKQEEEYTEDPVPAAQPFSVQPEQVQPYFYPYPQAPAQQGMQMPYQPIFVPIYYPMPQMPQMEIAQATGVPPTPAPEYLLPAPSPAVAEEESKLSEEPIEIETLDPTKKYNVRCPRCGKELIVRDSTPYHRCPACDKVFKLRKFETYVKRP